LSKDTKSYTKRQNISGLSILFKSLKNIDFQNANSGDLYNLLVKDLLAEQIFVVTPKGDVIDLKAGSTPIDFAYKIHTNIGNNCKMAKVNHQLVTLDYALQSGDIIEIITDRKQKPNKKWLEFAKMTETKERIRKELQKL
jgi:GTP diphosphokinase / guanosine-3',5'-bis(diphosphate) 3'-diphosphatase